MGTVAWKPLPLEPYVKLRFFFFNPVKAVATVQILAVYLLLLSNTSQEILSDITSSFSDFTPTSWGGWEEYLSTSSEQTCSEL